MPGQPVAAVQQALPNARTATALGDHSRVPRGICGPVCPQLCPCHHAAAWASRTRVPTEGMAAQSPLCVVLVPLPLGPLQPLPAPLPDIPVAGLPPFSIPALPSPCRGQACPSVLCRSSPQLLETLAPCSPGSALGSVHPSRSPSRRMVARAGGAI